MRIGCCCWPLNCDCCSDMSCSSGMQIPAWAVTPVTLTQSSGSPPVVQQCEHGRGGHVCPTHLARTLASSGGRTLTEGWRHLVLGPQTHRPTVTGLSPCQHPQAAALYGEAAPVSSGGARCDPVCGHAHTEPPHCSTEMCAHEQRCDQGMSNSSA